MPAPAAKPSADAREPRWIADIAQSTLFPRSRGAQANGIRSAFGFPLRSAGQVVAVLEFFSDIPAELDAKLLLTARAMGDQVGRVLERRRAGERLREEAQHRELLLAELNHRVKNMLAVVVGMASQTGRGSTSVPEFQKSFISRLTSLSRGYNLLTGATWQPAPLRDIALEVVVPHLADRDRQLEIGGPDITLLPKAALALSMILHELVTNATKYGALSVPTGGIAITWSVRETDGKSLVSLAWRESGVVGVDKPGPPWFGTRLIQLSARHELQGRVDVDLAPEGIRYLFEFPSASVRENDR